MFKKKTWKYHTVKIAKISRYDISLIMFDHLVSQQVQISGLLSLYNRIKKGHWFCKWLMQNKGLFVNILL